MDPNEKWPLRVFGEPCQCMRHHFSSAPLYRAMTIFSKTLILETGIVSIESSVKTRRVWCMRLKDNRAHKGCRVISVCPEYFRSIWEIGCQRRLHIIHLM